MPAILRGLPGLKSIQQANQPISQPQAVETSTIRAAGKGFMRLYKLGQR